MGFVFILVINAELALSLRKEWEDTVKLVSSVSHISSTAEEGGT